MNSSMKVNIMIVFNIIIINVNMKRNMTREIKNKHKCGNMLTLIHEHKNEHKDQQEQKYEQPRAH